MLPQLRSDPIRTFVEAADRYGDIVHLRAGPYHGYLLSGPADIKHVLQDNARNYHKSPLYDRLRDGFGEGLLTSEDSFWLRQRRLAQPAFHRQRLGAMADVMSACTQKTLDRWESAASRGETTDLVAEMMSLTQALLSRHPDIEQHVVGEVDRVTGGARPTFAHVERLTFTRRVLEESLRLYPPAWGFSRLALGDDEVGGYRVPRGSTVFLIPFVVHRRPKLWPDPDRYDPDRFTPEREAARPRFAYIPFGGGPRGCIGNQFARNST